MKIDLSDVTFTIPLRIDSIDRKNNIELILKFINNYFDTNVLLYEFSSKESKLDNLYNYKYKWIKDDSPHFHRTKILNLMARDTSTEIIANYDSDVIFNPTQIEKLVNLIRKNKCIGGLPYNGSFYDVPTKYYTELYNNLNVDIIKLEDCKCFNKNSYGGAFFWNKKIFISGGMENENCISWGHEDHERIVRFKKLGYVLGRVNGVLYHLTHQRDQNGGDTNPFYKKNEIEFNKILNMSIDQLKKYISTWNSQ